MVTICGVWIVAALFALPSAFSENLCSGYYEFKYIIYYERVILFEFVVYCVLPLFVIAFFYIMTARHLVKSARPVSEETQNPPVNTHKNTAKVVLGLSVVFLISYVPYHAFRTYTVFFQYPYITDWDYGINEHATRHRYTSYFNMLTFN